MSDPLLNNLSRLPVAASAIISSKYLNRIESSESDRTGLSISMQVTEENSSIEKNTNNSHENIPLSPTLSLSPSPTKIYLSVSKKQVQIISSNDKKYINNDFDRNENNDKNQIQPILSLSKALFNIEHYFLIPIMFLMSFCVYFDRGGLSSALNNMQNQLFGGSAIKGGIVASAYLFGFCISSPIFAILGSYYPPMKLASMGMLVWSLGTILTGILSSFYFLIASRLLTGIGEGSFLAFAGTIIDSIAPNHSRALWLAIFFMGIPLGYAFGFGIGGFIADSSIYATFIHHSEENESWRAIFILEALFVIPLCVLLYIIKSPANMLKIKEAKVAMQLEIDIKTGMRNIHDLHSNAEKTTFVDDSIGVKLCRILRNPTFLLISGGYATQTFLTGTFSVEAITYIENVYKWSPTKSGIIFGTMTLISGVTGSIFGGLVLDKLKSRMDLKEKAIIAKNARHFSSIDSDEMGSDSADMMQIDFEVIPPHKYIKIAAKFLCIISMITFPITFIAILVNTVPFFIGGVFLGEFLIFATQGPANTAILWSVLYADRPLAASINTLFIHAFGDACAPIIIGVIVDTFVRNGKSKEQAYNLAFMIASFWLILSAISWGLIVFTTDRLNEWFIAQEQDTNYSNLQHSGKSTPLLMNNTNE